MRRQGSRCARKSKARRAAWPSSISGMNSPAPIPISRRSRCRGLGGRGRGRESALAALPARADFRGAGLDDLALQSLSRQGTQHVARHGALCAAARLALAASQTPSRKIRCSRRGLLVAVPDDMRPDFSLAVFRAEFGEGRAISDEGVLSRVSRRLGLPAGGIFAKSQIRSRPRPVARGDRDGAKARAVRRAEFRRRGR